ncbi:DUF192 domain-containing protein [Candidatus Woesearchaeota archaeon]|nr:DUF192 domain-containing protein [Candidatus Woesearchaeota archaeon]
MKRRIADTVTLCTSFWKKGTGLMFRFPKGLFAYVFPFYAERRLVITMWFVFYSIDILFLDAADTVVEKVTLKPFSNYYPKAIAKTFIELPKGTIKQHDIALGQKVSWSNDFVDLL